MDPTYCEDYGNSDAQHHDAEAFSVQNSLHAPRFSSNFVDEHLRYQGIEDEQIEHLDQEGNRIDFDSAIASDNAIISSGFTSDITHGTAFAAGIPSKRKVRPEKAGLRQVTQTWIRIDQRGNAFPVSSDKYRIAIKLGVQPRDLRLLDPQLASVSPPAILDRERAIVVNLNSIKCIITLQYVLVVNNPEDDTSNQLVAVLKEKLSNPMHVGKVMSYPGLSRLSSITRHLHVPGTAAGVVLGLSFELKVLEICLDMAVSALDDEALELEQLITPMMEELAKHVKIHELEQMRRAKSRLTRLISKVETIKEVLEKFLQDDEDMHKLNLTAQELSRQASLIAAEMEAAAAAAAGAGAGKTGGQSSLKEFEGLLSSSPAATRMSSRLSRKHSQASSHSGTSSSSSGSSGSSKRSLEGELEIAQVEMLLEAYQMHLDRQYNKLQTLEQTVQDTEALVGTTLDTHRNRIISVDIVLTAFYTALGLGNACTALFGVNLNLESLVHDGGNMDFKLVAIVGVVVVPIVLMALFLVWVSRNRVIQF